MFYSLFNKVKRGEIVNKFYGVTELAKELKWKTAKVHTYWKQRKQIEEPYAFAGNRPLWTIEQVERIKEAFSVKEG
jgi:hypothetical protein